MNLKKLIALFLALLVISAVFVSCNNGNEPNVNGGGESTTASSVSTPKKELYFDMVDTSGKVCYVVYPSGAGEEVIELANKLSTRLKTVLGMKLPPVICETEIESNPGNYICIGKVNSAEILAYHDELKYSDIGYKVISENILSVAAHTDEYLAEAIKVFSNTFGKTITETKPMPDGSTASGRFYPSEASRTKTGTYKLSSLLIDGVDVSKYKVIYATDNEKAAAYAIRDSIGRATGAILPIAPSSDTELENEILVGATGREESKKYADVAQHNYKIAIDSGKLVVVAPHEILMGIATSYIETTLLSAESANTVALTSENDILGTTTIEGFDLVGKDEGDIRILSSNIYFESQTRERANTFLYTIPLYDADIICIQEMDSTWHHLLDNEIPKLGYTAVPTIGTGEYANKKHADNFTPIYYRADRYKLVDGGYQPYASVKDTKENIFVKYPELAKLNDKQKQSVLNEYIRNGTTYGCVGHLSKSFSWAIFESLETGERFGVISTHMTHDNSPTVANIRRMYDAKEVLEKTEALKNRYNVDFVMTGDFNFNYQENPYAILKDGGYADAYRSAELAEYHYTTHTMGQPPETNGQPIDLCFHTEGIDANKYQIVVNEYTITYSDHMPIAFDFKLK